MSGGTSPFGTGGEGTGLMPAGYVEFADRQLVMEGGRLQIQPSSPKQQVSKLVEYIVLRSTASPFS